jgi:hypothetical protein
MSDRKGLIMREESAGPIQGSPRGQPLARREAVMRLAETLADRRVESRYSLG